MGALHVIACSPDSGAAVQNCLRTAAADDAVVLIGNGVYCAVAGAFSRIAKRSPTTKWYALETDVARRGIAGGFGAGVELIDDSAFVDLVTSHQPIVSWS
jgi:sulfur relay protein TusB/DsrH